MTILLLLACAPASTPPAPEAMRLFVFHDQYEVPGGALYEEFRLWAWYGDKKRTTHDVTWSVDNLPTMYDWEDVLVVEVQTEDLLASSWVDLNISVDCDRHSPAWLGRGCEGFSVVTSINLRGELFHPVDDHGHCRVYLNGEKPTGEALSRYRSVGWTRTSWPPP